MDTPIEPTSAEPATLGVPPSVPSADSNHDDETALARLADDGGPPPPEFAPPPEPSPTPPPPVATLVIPEATPSLEQRVRRLEDALAQFQEQRGVETRITAQPPALSPLPAIPPAVAATPPASTAVFLDAGKRLLGAAADAVRQAPPPTSSASPPADGGVLWLLWDAWAEARAIVRMFVDPRYHLAWSSRAIPLLLLAAFVIPKKYWVPGAQIPILGDWLFSRILDLLLAFVLFKWLGHEARRYRYTSPDLPPHLRL